MSRYHSAIALAIVLAVLGGIAYWDDTQTKKDEASEKTKNKLVSFSQDAVEKISYESGELKVELEKNDGIWNLSGPIRAKAEQGVVTSLLQTLSDYKFEKQVGDNSESWTKFGLDKPERKITLGFKGDKTVSIFVGAKSPVGYSVYSRTSDSDKSYIGAQHLSTATEKKLNDFRDRTFFDVKDDQLIRVQIKRANELITLERSAAKEPFALKIKGQALPTDTDAVSDFLSSLRSEKTEDFSDRPEKSLVNSFASQKTLGSISFDLVDGSKKTLLIAEHEKKIYVSYDPANLAYRVADSFKDKLLKKDSMSFRDKSIAKFSAGDVIETTVDDTTYVKVAGEWKKKGEEKPESASFTHIQNLIVDLEYARADHVWETVDPKIKNTLKTKPMHKVALKFKADLNRADLGVQIWMLPKGTDSSKATGAEEKIVIVPVAGTFAFETKKSILDNMEPKAATPPSPTPMPSLPTMNGEEAPSSVPEDTD